MFVEKAKVTEYQQFKFVSRSRQQFRRPKLEKPVAAPYKASIEENSLRIARTLQIFFVINVVRIAVFRS